MKYGLALRKHRDAVLAQLRTLGVDVATLHGDPADVAMAIDQSDATLARRASLVESLRSIEAALARIDAGTYGRCEDCGQVVAAKRLAAMPDARLCIRCQAIEEARVARVGRRDFEEAR